MPDRHHGRMRPLGTMVAYGFARGDVGVDIAIARRIGATVMEILPDWRAYPDPKAMRRIADDAGLGIHSAHGCWAGQAIAAERVDLSHPEPAVVRESVIDLKRCVDWLAEAGGRCLVVHPGGLADPQDFEPRRKVLCDSLIALADHAAGTEVVLCVENMPPGVYPGSRMADLRAVVAELDRPELALALDTGHAQLNATPAEEVRAAGPLLRTTHVHDNNGRADSHDPPGRGVIAWMAWREALDEIDYDGPIMLECIRRLRQDPDVIDGAFLELLGRLKGAG